MRPNVLPHPPFPAHALLDSGAGEKLERFGDVVVRRPDPQAVWARARDDAAWERADLAFERETDRGGRWNVREGAPEAVCGKSPEWTIPWGDAVFVLRPTPFKHVGLFPEQAANWARIVELAPKLDGARDGGPSLLNLFGYTGAASVVAAQAGYQVTHVDASRAALTWTRENAVRSGLAEDAVRVIFDDALAFARRDVRRGNRYDVVLLDPPHYGRGPKGEKWQFEDGIAPLIEAANDDRDVNVRINAAYLTNRELAESTMTRATAVRDEIRRHQDAIAVSVDGLLG